MNCAFHLLEEPWIPVRDRNGKRTEISLNEALLKAHQYAELIEDSPINLVALHRLLLAVLHRALSTSYETWNDRDRARWFREGLPSDAIRDYLDKWKNRFWLFHPSEPFMQVAALKDAQETSDAVFPVSILCLNQFFGTPLFNHGVHDMGERPTAIVLRDMLGYMQFIPGGFFPGKKLRGSDKAGPLANTAAVLPLGENLAQTLLLGLHPPGDAQDLPCWERPQPTFDELRAEPKLAQGINDRYARLTRAVLLEAGSSCASVRRTWLAAGLALEPDPHAPDPMASHRITQKNETIPVSFREGRAFWRELPSLVPAPGGAQVHPPAILGWAANLYNALGKFDADVNILCAGLTSDQAKPLRWRVERIVLPEALLNKEDGAAFLRTQVQLAEEVFDRLQRLLVEMIAQSLPAPNHKKTLSHARKIAENTPAASAYFSTVERALAQMMKSIVSENFDAATSIWNNALTEAVQKAWEAARKTLGDSAAIIRAQAQVWPRYKGLLKTFASTTREECIS